MTGSSGENFEDFSVWTEELGYPLAGYPGSQLGEVVDSTFPRDAMEWQKWAEAPVVLPTGGLESLLEEKLRRETGLEPAEVDFEALMADFDWKANFSTDYNSPEFQRGLDMVVRLREGRGIFDVIVSLAAKDLETGRLLRIPGKAGIHVRKSPGQSDMK